MWFRPGPQCPPAATCGKSDQARTGTWEQVGQLPVQKFWWGADRAPVGKNVAPLG